jgi:acetyl esterase/lipase
LTDSLAESFDLITEKYGHDEYQEGALYLPKGNVRGTICLFHGGFWKMPYDRSEMSPVAIRFARMGFVVWNVEYRRTGTGRGGYPETFEDAVDSVNWLLELQKTHRKINLEKVFIAGHSAGGHLALWLDKKGNGITKNVLLVKPSALIGMAPVVNLEKSYESNDGNGAVIALLGVRPDEDRKKYRETSPSEMLPAVSKQLILIGTEDTLMTQVETYALLGGRTNSKIELRKIENCGHMDFVNPFSEAIDLLLQWIIKRTEKESV